MVDSSLIEFTPELCSFIRKVGSVALQYNVPIKIRYVNRNKVPLKNAEVLLGQEEIIQKKVHKTTSAIGCQSLNHQDL